jgi:Leucine-rich repeat (LRR) protein
VVSSGENRKKTFVNRAEVTQAKYDLAFLDKDSKNSHVDSAGNLIIIDSILERKIKDCLAIKQNEPISILRAGTVSNLDLSNKTSDSDKIKNIDALAFFKNLISLNLSNHDVKNIYPLQKLENLTELNLSRNQVRDISVLARLPQLESLNLYDNLVIEISYLAYLKNLKSLNLWSNEVSDISSLQGLTELYDLNLGSNFIRNISPLKNLLKLRSLHIPFNQLNDPEIISEFGSQLTYLSIANCGISDIRFLKGCTQLNSLNISDNKIVDISILNNFKSLNVLYAANNQIANVDVLAVLVNNGAFSIKPGFKNQDNIDLSNNKIDLQDAKTLKIITYLKEKVFKLKI